MKLELHHTNNTKHGDFSDFEKVEMGVAFMENDSMNGYRNYLDLWNVASYLCFVPYHCLLHDMIKSSQ